MKKQKSKSFILPKRRRIEFEVIGNKIIMTYQKNGDKYAATVTPFKETTEKAIYKKITKTFALKMATNIEKILPLL